MTVPLWVPILVAFLGVSGTLGAALLTQWISNNRADQREKSRQEHEIAKEAQRQEHENHLKELELEGTRIEKKRDESIKAYRALLQVTGDIDSRSGYEFSDLLEAYSEIELVSDSQPLISTAWDLVGVCNAARKITTDAYKEAPDRDPATVQEVRDAIFAKDRVRKQFIQLAREDLSRGSTRGH